MIQIGTFYFNATQIQALTIDDDVVEVWLQCREESVCVGFDSEAEAEHALAKAGLEWQSVLSS
jgi:hypothetical protein